MPDQNEPYYNNPGQQYGQDIPNPSQSMMDYSYLQNNQQVMNSGQSNVAGTMRIAQDNFHRDMQNVLQGSMTAAMAIYNTGKSAVDKAKETQYQDQLFNGGNYVLERGFMREMAWASGIAQSDFGRSMKLGGRKPEFLSQEELEFQMQRSWHHRMEDLGVEAGGGAVGAGSSLLGMALTKSMRFVKGSVLGLATDQIAGRLYDVGVAQPKEYRRELADTTEITDLNAGVGQRRMDRDTSDELADRFYHRDRQDHLRYIPLIGDYLAERKAPDTKASEIMPKMMQLGMFRDQNLKDVDKMEKFVIDTIGIVEKFAGLANTTKDAILGLKAKLNNLGYDEKQQNSLMGKMVTTSMSTGLDLATVANYGQMFGQMGLQAGMNKGIVTQSGLTELASTKALQEAGFIDRSLDPGSLSIRNTQRGIAYGQDGYGFVNRFSGNAPNPQSATATAAAYLANRGGGSTAAGTVLMQYGMLKDATDPNANLKKAAVNIFEEAKKMKLSDSEAYATVVSTLKPQNEEDRSQIRAALFQDGMGEMLAAGSAARKEADRTGDKTKSMTFSLNDVGASSFSIYSDKSSKPDFDKIVKEVKAVKAYDKGSKEEVKYQDFKTLYSGKVKEMYNALLSEDVTKAKTLKQEILKDVQNGKEDYNKEEAERALNVNLAELDKSSKNKIKLDDIKTTTKSDDSENLSFGLEKYYKGIKGTKVTDEERSKFSGFQSLFNDRIGKLYSSLLKGDLTQADKIKASIMDDATRGTGTGNNLSQANAEKAINMVLGDIENKQESYRNNKWYTLQKFEDIRKEKGGAGRLTISDAIKDAAGLKNDPKEYGKIDSTTYTKADDKVQGIFRKLLSDPKNKDRGFKEDLYNLAGTGDVAHNTDMIKAIFNDKGTWGDKALTSDEQKELKSFISNNGDKALVGLFSEETKKIDATSNYGLRNSFLGLAAKGDKYKDIKFSGEGGYKEKVELLKKNITELKSMDAGAAKEWLKKYGKDFAYNAEIATGNADFGKSLTRGIETMAGLSNEEYKDYMNKGWFKTMDITTANTESVKKEFGMSTDNPNTIAVNELAKACKRLADAIGG